jgi:hypothetical protein
VGLPRRHLLARTNDADPEAGENSITSTLHRISHSSSARRRAWVWVWVCMGVCSSAMLRESLVVHRRACADSDDVVHTATAAGGTMEAVDRGPSGGGWPRRRRPPLLRCCESRANPLRCSSRRCTLTWRSQKEPPAATPLHRARCPIDCTPPPNVPRTLAITALLLRSAAKTCHHPTCSDSCNHPHLCSAAKPTTRPSTARRCVASSSTSPMGSTTGALACGGTSRASRVTVSSHQLTRCGATPAHTPFTRTVTVILSRLCSPPPPRTHARAHVTPHRGHGAQTSEPTRLHRSL